MLLDMVSNLLKFLQINLYRVWMIGHQILTLVNKGSPDVTQNLFNFVQSSPKSKPFPPMSITIEYHVSLQQLLLCPPIASSFYLYIFMAVLLT